MKQSIFYLLLAVGTAGFSVAQEQKPLLTFGPGGAGGGAGSESQSAIVSTNAPRGEGRRGNMQPQQQQQQQRNKRSGSSDEQRAEAKARYEEIAKLAEEARAEMDPVKKEQMVVELRAKLTEGATRMQEDFQRRLETAEQEVAKMKERLKESAQTLDARVEEHLQELLSGEQVSRKGLGGGEGSRHKGSPRDEDETFEDPAPAE
jgi:hypothetical protein